MKVFRLKFPYPYLCDGEMKLNNEGQMNAEWGKFSTLHDSNTKKREHLCDFSSCLFCIMPSLLFFLSFFYGANAEKKYFKMKISFKNKFKLIFFHSSHSALLPTTRYEKSAFWKANDLNINEVFISFHNNQSGIMIRWWEKSFLDVNKKGIKWRQIP